MELYKYDNLMSLESSSYNWKCRVRAKAVWSAMNKDTKEVWDINMILIDDCKNRIHAFASAKYCQEVEKELNEGGIYVISNFKVKDYLGDETNRPVRTEKHIFFTAKMKKRKDEDGWLQIEKYAFDLFHMMDIERIANDNRFLIDMVGIVENLRDVVTTIKNDVETKRLKFDLTDGRDTVKVTLFGDFGMQCEKALLNSRDRPIVIILACAKVNRYEGKCNLTNYPATRMYINPDHYSVDILKKKHEAMCALEFTNLEEEEKFELMTISQIKQLTSEYVEKTVSCQVSVKKLDEQGKWYSNICVKCKAEVDREGKIFRCPQCKRIIPYPEKRFQVYTLCSDETGTIAIVFPDVDICRVIGKTVYDIQAAYPQDMKDEPFPYILNQLINQKFTLSILLGKDNILKGSNVYNATEIFEEAEAVDTYTPGKQENMVIEPSSINNALQDLEKSDVTMATRNSSTKTRARKTVDPVPYDDGNHTLNQIKNGKKSIRR